MSDTVRCPDCGRETPADGAACVACGFPLERAEAPGSAPPPEAAPPAEPPGEADAAGEAPLTVPRPPRRPPRARPVNAPATMLWLIFGVFAAMFVLWIAVKANVDRARQPVPGSSAAQQARADELRERLAADSTQIDAHVALGDVLYDTGNWTEAIVHYRAALRRDSTRATVIVDLGVCYYNLGDSSEAERLFHAALARDPHQPVALFNLGIVHERREEYERSLQYFHRSLQSDPPEAMREPLVEALRRVQEKSGRTAPPLPGGR